MRGSGWGGPRGPEDQEHCPWELWTNWRSITLRDGEAHSTPFTRQVWGRPGRRGHRRVHGGWGLGLGFLGMEVRV